MLTLNTIKAQPGSVHKRKRLGRGSGSGHGPTAGKGDKGQLQRSGGTSRPGFEGGQMPLYRRLPKRGFTNPGRRTNAIVNLVDLNKSSIKDVNLETLMADGLVKGRHDRLAILATGEITRAVHVKAHRVSAQAQEKIKKAGGTVEILPIPASREILKREDKKKPSAKAKK